MKVQFSARIANRAWRHDPETGFLRCTAVILAVGVLDYQPSELPPEAPAPDAQGRVRIAVLPQFLAEPESLASLEGMPAVVGHTWQDVRTAAIACGNVAGTPYVSGPDLLADILVVDPDAVRRIMLPEGDPDKLQEISSAYDSVIDFTPGVDVTTGEQYHGVFTNIRYNHVAILPPGRGRAGSSV
jgi:hypothetical protein